MLIPQFIPGRLIRLLVVSACVLVTAPSASAHQLWLELLNGKEIVARFGHVGGEEHEKSPGRLDRFQSPVAWSPYAGTDIEPDVLEVVKKSDHFLIVDAAVKRPLVFETTVPVMKREPEDGSAPVARHSRIFARWHVAGMPSAPSAPFDVVPSETAGKATVFLHGKPLAGAKFRLFRPDGKPVALEADENGVLSYEAKTPGLYVLWGNHSEPGEGMHLGSPYNARGYTMALSWQQP